MWPIDVQRILSIPISQHDMPDFIAWSYTKNGMFSVRSAYFVELDHHYGSRLRHSNGMGRVRYGSYRVRQKSKNLHGVHYMERFHVGLRLQIDIWRSCPFSLLALRV